MLIKTANFKKSISTVLPGIESGSVTNEGGDLVIFMDGKIMSYNGKVAVSVPFTIDAAEAFGIKAKDLYSMLSKLKEEEIEAEANTTAHTLKIKCGKFKASLIMQDVSTITKLLGKLKFGEEIAIPEKFSDATKVVEISDNKTTLKGYAVGKVGEDTYLISTDKVRISAYKLNQEMKQFLVNDDLVNQAVSFGTIKTYSIVGPWLHLGYEDGAHFSILRSDDTVFPFEAMGNALMRAKTLDAIAKFSFPATLAEVAERVTTMGNVDVNSRLQCQLKIESDKLTVIAEKSTGSAEEEITWEKPIEISEPVNVWVPVKTLLNLAGKSTECKVVSMGGVKKAMLIETESYTMVASCSR